MNTDALIAGIIAFLGGTGFTSLLKFFDKKKEVDISTEAALRQELIDQINTIRSEMEELKKEVEYWRTMYLDLYKEHTEIKAQLGMKDKNS